MSDETRPACVMSPKAREAARGIPVWEGAMEIGGGRVEGFTEHGVVLKREGSLVGACHPAFAGPDLADPDTRAAHDRRLALALGAPIEAVDRGVSVLVRRSGFGCTVEVLAGARWDWINDDEGQVLRFEWSHEVDIDDPVDDLHARALAYPADMRVR